LIKINSYPKYLSAIPDDRSGGGIAKQSTGSNPTKISAVEKQNSKRQAIATELGINEYQLENGLRIVFVPTNETNIVASLIINSGSLDDPKDKKGLAHFLEHLASHQGSENFDEYEFDDFAHATFGSDGATTTEQATYFDIDLHPRYFNYLVERIEKILKPISGLSQKRVDKEKQIIHNEFNEGEFLNEDGSFRSNNLFWDNPDDPRNYQIIGLRKDIESFTSEDLELFSKEHYRPDNAVVILRGGFNEEKALKKLSEKLGKIQKPETNISRNKLPVFAKQTRYKKITLENPHCDGIDMRFKIPGINNGDMDALEALAFLVKEKLIDANKDLAIDEDSRINTDVTDYGDSGVFSVRIFLPEGSNGRKADLEKQTLQIIKSIKRTGVDPDDFQYLQDIRHHYISSLSRDPSTRADFVTSNEKGSENWKSKIDRLKQRIIDAGDIKKVVAEYIDNSNLTTVFHVKSPNRSPGRVVEEVQEKKDITVDDIELKIPRALKDGTKVQDLKNPFKPKIIKTDDYKLVAIKDESDNKIVVELENKGGQRACHKDKSCLADLTEIFMDNLLNFKPKRGVALKHYLLENDAKLDFEFSESSGSFFASAKDESFDTLLELVKASTSGEIFEYFSKEDLEEILADSKEQLYTDHHDAESDTGVLAITNLREIIFKDAPELLDPSLQETAESLTKISINDIKNFLQQSLQPKNANIAVTGNFDDLKLGEIESKLSESITQSNHSPFELKKLEAQANTEAETRSLSIQNRASITAQYGKSWNRDPERKNEEMVLSIVEYLLSKKLFLAARRNSSQLYDIETRLTTIPDSNLGYTGIGFEANKGEQDYIKSLIKAVLDQITEKGFSEEEMMLAKTYLLYKEDTTRNDGKGIDPFRFFDGYEADFEDYKSRLNKVSLAEINRVAKTTLNSNQFSYATVA
jgi:predicted Zn-dependent peptidase